MSKLNKLYEMVIFYISWVFLLFLKSQSSIFNTLNYHIIYKSSIINKVHDKFGIMYFENQITMQFRSRD